MNTKEQNLQEELKKALDEAEEMFQEALRNSEWDRAMQLSRFKVAIYFSMAKETK